MVLVLVCLAYVEGFRSSSSTMAIFDTWLLWDPTPRQNNHRFSVLIRCCKMANLIEAQA